MPAAFRQVGTISSVEITWSVVCPECGSPGRDKMKGTRIPPSHRVNLLPAKGKLVAPLVGAPPLSEKKMTMVLSVSFNSSKASSQHTYFFIQAIQVRQIIVPHLLGTDLFADRDELLKPLCVLPVLVGVIMWDWLQSLIFF